VSSDYFSKIIAQLMRESDKRSPRIPSLLTRDLGSERVKFQIPTTGIQTSIYSYINHFGLGLLQALFKSLDLIVKAFLHLLVHPNFGLLQDSA